MPDVPQEAVYRGVALPPLCPRRPASLRSVRPSLLDLRFTGDPWIVDHRDGTASLCLDDYRLARIEVLFVDVPSFYQVLTRMRQLRSRRRPFQCIHRIGVA
jgi:hypothetical protein